MKGGRRTLGSRYNYDFDMKYTDNPYIDLIVNCVKILGMNAVVKNENQALHYEDSRSAIEASKLMKYKEGHWNTAKDGYFDEDYYMEWNSYYRMLNGLPPIGYPDIYVDEWRVTDVTLDLSIPLHKMSKSTILILDNKGILKDTVIVMLADHYPYGLDLDEINAIAKEADKLQSKGKTKEAAEKYEDYQEKRLRSRI